MSNDGPIPIVETYRGVGLHDQQSPARLAVVKAEIDLVLTMTDAAKLVDYAADAMCAPEARLLAASMAETVWEMAAETRAIRPAIDIDRLRAVTAGLDSANWRSPWWYGALFDHKGVPRERPLE
jgi:hypothetical protein